MRGVSIFEFTARKEIVLEFTEDQLRSFVKMNIHRDADVIVRDGKLYIMFPFDIMGYYEIQGDKIVIKLPAKV